MDNHSRILWMTLLVTAVVVTVSGEISQETINDIDHLVKTISSCAGVPGVSIAYIKLDGTEESYRRAYGVSDPERNQPSSVSHKFCLGGATRAFTAVLLAKLIEEHESITWDTPVQDILQYRLSMPDMYRADHLNLKDILAMRSGLDGMDMVTLAEPYDRRGFVRMLRFAPKVSGFREQYVYNDALFALIEDVVQAMANDSWHNLMKKHIFQPLNMRDTEFLGTSDYYPHNMVVGTYNYGKKPMNIPYSVYSGYKVVAPATSICSSTSDMAKWVNFLIRKGVTATGGRLLSQEALEETFVPVMSRGYSSDPIIVGYRQPKFQATYSRDQNALGWVTGQYRGFQAISQDGSLPGYQSLVTIIPSKNIGVFVAMTGDPSPEADAAKVMITYLGLETLIESANWYSQVDACSILRDMAKAHPVKRNPVMVTRISAYEGPRHMENYVGTYRNYAFGDVVVSYNASIDENVLKLEFGKAMYTLYPTTANDTFQMFIDNKYDLYFTTNGDFYRKTKTLAMFAEDPHEGRIQELTLPSFDRNFDPVFSTNPQRPYVDWEGKSGDDRCAACSLITSVWTLALLALCAVVYVR